MSELEFKSRDYRNMSVEMLLAARALKKIGAPNDVIEGNRKVARMLLQAANTEENLKEWCDDLTKFLTEETSTPQQLFTLTEIEDLKESGLWREQ